MMAELDERLEFFIDNVVELFSQVKQLLMFGHAEIRYQAATLLLLQYQERIQVF